MKIKWMIAVALVGTLVTSCNKDEDRENMSSTSTSTPVPDDFTGRFKVDKAIVNDEDKTAEMIDKEFLFINKEIFVKSPVEGNFTGRFDKTSSTIEMDFGTHRSMDIFNDNFILHEGVDGFQINTIAEGDAKTIHFTKITERPVSDISTPVAD